MSNLLGLDLGTAKTGVAFADETHGFLMALSTIRHKNLEELLSVLEKIIHEKKIEKIIVGLPRLMSGDEGGQASIVREVTEKIVERTKLPVAYIDERLTSGDGRIHVDDDARAACQILQTYMDNGQSVKMA